MAVDGENGFYLLGSGAVHEAILCQLFWEFWKIIGSTNSALEQVCF
jgi:hypothetical protein